jgi:hypothetical protein
MLKKDLPNANQPSAQQKTWWRKRDSVSTKFKAYMRNFKSLTKNFN